MTYRRYASSTDLSRIKTRSDKPRHSLGGTARPGRLFGAHFEALQPDSAEHPIDRVVDRLPVISALTRKALRRAEIIQRQVKDQKAFLEYEDLRLHLRSEREVAYFNIGHEHGQVAGRLYSGGVRDKTSRALEREVLRAVSASRLPAPRVAVVLLELARAHIVGPRGRWAAGRQAGARR